MNMTRQLQLTPLVGILGLFVIVPLAMIFAVSFFQYDIIAGMVPDFTLDNYAEIFSSSQTISLYASTFKFAAAVWFLTLLIGFTVAYFLVFHIRNTAVSIILFLVCTVPFWTSTIIRTISWVPLLGKAGLVNQFLLGIGAVDSPIEWLLFSDFSVVVAYVHLFTLFMIVPIFNSMARIDKSLLEAARDTGATPFATLIEVVIPLSKNGIALGSVFVIALVMGDFSVVKVMSGGRSASVVSAMFDDISLLYYPAAAAKAVVLLVIVIMVIGLIMRMVDVREELTRS